MDITFTISFHGPFHIGSGVPDQGLDRILDRDDLVPASSLKGAMRAAAREVLKLDVALVGAVFGDSSQPDPGVASRRRSSPWEWSHADLGDHTIQNLARIRMDDTTGTVARGFLMLGEVVWADTATFTVRQSSSIDGDLGDHLLVLRAAARAVTSLGGGRRRGEGWVTISDPEAWGADDTRSLRALGGTR